MLGDLICFKLIFLILNITFWNYTQYIKSLCVLLSVYRAFTMFIRPSGLFRKILKSIRRVDFIDLLAEPWRSWAKINCVHIFIHIQSACPYSSRTRTTPFCFKLLTCPFNPIFNGQYTITCDGKLEKETVKYLFRERFVNASSLTGLCPKLP